jgi:hypothetical protein
VLNWVVPLSFLILWIPLVTICTTCINIHYLCFLPPECVCGLSLGQHTSLQTWSVSHTPPIIFSSRLLFCCPL